MVAVVLAFRRRARLISRILGMQVTPAAGQAEQEAGRAVLAVQALQVLTVMLVQLELLILQELHRDLLRPVILELVVLVQTPQDSAQMVHL